MRLYVCLAAVLASLISLSVRASVLSGNLIVNGDFESTANLKTSGSLDASNNYIPIHRWNGDTDFERWIAMFGPPSQADNPAALAGFSMWDDPRTDPPGNTQQTGDLGTMNRSVDPFNGGNHVMENALFRTRMAQWIPAPANHVPGPISFSFDFYIDLWSATSAPWFQIGLYGLNFTPPHDTPYLTDNSPGNAVTPLGAEPTGGGEWNPADLDGDPLAFFRFGSWHNIAPAPGHPDFRGNFDTWNTLDTDDADNDLWLSSLINSTPNIRTTELTQTYDYYAVVLMSVAYGESDPYWWLYSPDARITDATTLLWDNIVLQLSVEDSVPDPVPADFSIDALVNTEDINPFILALTNTTAWLNYARPLLPEGLTDQQIIDYADPNGDGSINTEDIAWFICWLTTPGSCGGGGGGAIIPEPASLSLLGLGALALLRRRR